MMESRRNLDLREVYVQKPLFPNYLFVRFHAETQLPYVRWTKGVRKILPESIRPTTVDDQVVESIRALAHKDGIIRKRLMRKNDSVKILRGPFRDLIGIFEEWTSDSGRVRILLRFVNYEASLELHHTMVERVA